MMSQCYHCRTPTDLALSDVMTAEELAARPNVPLVGVCDKEECKQETLRSIRDIMRVSCPCCGQKFSGDHTTVIREFNAHILTCKEGKHGKSSSQDPIQKEGSTIPPWEEGTR